MADAALAPRPAGRRAPRALLAPLLAALLAPAPAAAHTDDPAAAATEVPSATLAIGNPTPALFARDLEMADTLGIGRISRDIARTLPALEALGTALEGALAGSGFSRARPAVARDEREMVDFLRRGIVDLASDTPMGALRLAEASGGEVLLVERAGGRATYRSLTVVAASSPLTSIADLAGRKLAFATPTSTTGFLLPDAAIRRAGLRPVGLEDSAGKPWPDTVGFYFAGSRAAAVAAVEEGFADAGAISSEDWDRLAGQEPARAARLRVLHESAPVPRALLVAGPHVSLEQRERLASILLSMDADPAGRAALEAYGRVDHFEPVDSDVDKQLRELRADIELVREDIR